MAKVQAVLMDFRGWLRWIKASDCAPGQGGQGVVGAR